RRWLGRTGALMAGVLLLVSPSVLFHSRYIRNDIYIAFFAMIWVYTLFRYLEDRQTRWLYGMAVSMALGFATKENQFMTGALFGAFLAGMALWRSVGWRSLLAWALIAVGGLAVLARPEEGAGRLLALFVAGVSVLAGAGLLGVFLGRGGWDRLRRLPEADLAVIMLTLVLPFTAPFGYLILPWEPVNWSAPSITGDSVARWASLVIAMTLLAVGIAYAWFGVVRKNDENAPSFATWGGLMLTFWAIAIIFFTTFFTNPVRGLATGIVGSLGYWLAQQEVQRGSQPWYYYILLGLLYEFLPIIASFGGLAALIRHLRRRGWEPVPVTDLPEADPEKRDGRDPKAERKKVAEWQPLLTRRDVRVFFVIFLAWWAASSWLAYSYAGEKMPWLMTHMAQPMAIFGGWWVGRLIHRVDWKHARANQSLWSLLLIPALLFALGTLIAAWPPFAGRDVESLNKTVRFFLALFVVGGLAYGGRVLVRRSSAALVTRLAGLGALTVLLVLTVRFSYMLTYVNYDMATEYLVYAHGGPDVKRAVQEIETISQRTVGDRMIRVAYDDDVAWPMTWYMRFFPNSIYYGSTPSNDAMSADVILVGNKNYSKVEPYVVRDYVSRTYRLVWWPEESYKGPWDPEAGRSKGLTLQQIWENLTVPEKRSRLWQIWFYRSHPGLSVTAWPHRHEFRMYVRRDLANIVWDLNVTPLTGAASNAPVFDYEDVDVTALAVYGGIYDGLAITQPRDVAVGPDGRRYILDTGNNRVVVLERDGTFVFAFGSTCSLAEGAISGCVDPDGAGPLELGDGQFREPWGITVAQDGTIFVADTWNGRIQVFDNQGQFLRKWGTFAIVEDVATGDPYWLFGPRGLAVNQAGNLLVADTGNKRIIEYTPDGAFVRQVGGGGIILGRFQEPVDVAVDPRNGNVVVADVWNQRIQLLSPNLDPLAEWPIPGWESQDIWDKAYVA
ncbi:MAG: phospholipid carrier-dependent glycosyltransferase, partial [Caldilineae bacterium]